ncbi:DNA mismatch repair protein MutS [Blattabacterium cuenoti]|uniref:DNA mismatch repair protein MutS n=1 Tax=Blattabacterium cuenoti TaxID=1653831 RepID=UPI00163D1099|nr:DNA mismatch repair protein MutS [Blattabacterium cuenoti]
MRKKEEKETPLIKQYNDIKSKYPDTILLFQVGDFYEIFGEDAIKCSEVLSIVLTKRSNIYLAGFPCHSIDSYLPKLIQYGLRVAICDQLEEPKKVGTLVKRGVTELVTPGLAINDNFLKIKSNNFLASIHIEKNYLGLSFLDISTGEFFIVEDDKNKILQYLTHFNPSEVLFQKNKKNFFDKLIKNKYYTFLIEDWIFDYSFAYEKLTSHFKTNSLKGFGIENLKLGIIASGVILSYLHNTHHVKIQHISSIKKIKKEGYMWIDHFTFRSLEIFNSINNDGISLVEIMDKTITPMGGRLLKNWISFPLIDIDHIEKRHQIVQEICCNDEIRIFIKKKLKYIQDIERVVSKIAIGKITPRELFMLHKSLEIITEIKKIFLIQKSNIFISIGNSIENCDFISNKITKTIEKDPPNQIEKGKANVIVKGVSKELDEMRMLYFSQKEYLDQLLLHEKLQTQISNIKIGYNNIFGYFFEIKKNTKKCNIPSYWIQKQTLSNSERYITEKLKNFESKIFNIESKIFLLEKEIFFELINQILKNIKILQKNSKIIAKIDVLFSFSTISLENNYVKPTMNNSTELYIKSGRHPVIEKKFQSKSYYIPNDILLNKKNQQILIITGPNMSGKSAVLRQTAIIILMAHVGCFIPAKEAKIGLIDKIFSRVGASDNISLGESTFMVEMNETANILNNLSERSFLILDEIGRGTSTYDGVSIAKSVIEFLHNHHLRPITMFATHYHELNNMNISFQRIKNLHVLVKKINDNIVFMRKLVPGISEHSFGIYVAKISGMPKKVICRAKTLLKKNINEKKKKEKLYFYLKEIEKIKTYQDDLIKKIKNLLKNK